MWGLRWDVPVTTEGRDVRMGCASISHRGAWCVHLPPYADTAKTAPSIDSYLFT
jgi:hypothetical protein